MKYEIEMKYKAEMEANKAETKEAERKEKRRKKNQRGEGKRLEVIVHHRLGLVGRTS